MIGIWNGNLKTHIPNRFYSSWFQFLHMSNDTLLLLKSVFNRKEKLVEKHTS